MMVWNHGLRKVAEALRTSRDCSVVASTHGTRLYTHRLIGVGAIGTSACVVHAKGVYCRSEVVHGRA